MFFFFCFFNLHAFIYLFVAIQTSAMVWFISIYFFFRLLALSYYIFIEIFAKYGTLKTWTENTKSLHIKKEEKRQKKNWIRNQSAPFSKLCVNVMCNMDLYMAFIFTRCVTAEKEIHTLNHYVCSKNGNVFAQQKKSPNGKKCKWKKAKKHTHKSATQLKSIKIWNVVMVFNLEKKSFAKAKIAIIASCA